MEADSLYILNTDGGARGNPGPAGAGYVITDYRLQISKLIQKGNKYIGTATNNVAEYQALILGLTECTKLGIKNLEVRMDSELIVRQLMGVYRVKDKNLCELFLKVKELEKEFFSIKYKHIPREDNKEADRLVNEILDSSLNSKC